MKRRYRLKDLQDSPYMIILCTPIKKLSVFQLEALKELLTNHVELTPLVDWHIDVSTRIEHSLMHFQA